jgi:hypothetical protein
MTTPQPDPANQPNIHRPSIGVAGMIALSVLIAGQAGPTSNAHPGPVSTTSAHSALQAKPALRQAAREPRITFVDPPTPKAREVIVWAIGRFRDAGLQLPDLQISFPTFCGGKAALYHVGRRSIDFCLIHKRTVLHEFAHAWDDTSGAVDRQAFLKLRGLNIWWGGTGMASSEQGAEQLAQIVAWGLMDVDTRGVPRLPGNSVSELTTAFVMVTGGAKPRHFIPAANRPS